MIATIYRNIHEALPEMVDLLLKVGIQRDARLGHIIQFPGPVLIKITNPTERVLFWDERDANPYYHFFEALWMLGGRNDVEFIAQFELGLKELSDDGISLHGAYGQRWLSWFQLNQVALICDALRINPTCHRQVLGIWDPTFDLEKITGRDLPHETCAYFQRDIAGNLDMMVCSRANDLGWGAFGSTPVHFSMLLEYMAARISCEVGTYSHVIFNLNESVAVLERTRLTELAEKSLAGKSEEVVTENSPYRNGSVKTYPMVSTVCRNWDDDLKVFLQSNGTVMGLRDKFFTKVAAPMMASHIAHITGDRKMAIEHAERIRASDWRIACIEWLNRRYL